MTKTCPNFGCVARRGESWDLIARSFFVFLFVGGFFVCRFRCSWPGDVMVHPSLRSSNGARRGTMSEGYKCGWVQSQESEIKVDNGTRRARTVSA